MIEARKRPLFLAWFARHARRRLERTFGTISVRGLAQARRLLETGPVLVVSNHPSWWDALVILSVTVHDLDADSFALMDATQLRALPFFSLVGAFGVDLDDPRDGARAIRYAAKRLTEPRRLVWVFPQGRERPITARTLAFRDGSALIAKIARRATVLPAAIRYEFGSSETPDLYLSFGDPLERPEGASTSEQERAVQRELERIDRSIVEGVRDDFALLHTRPKSRVQAFMERALARATRRLAGPADPARPVER